MDDALLGQLESAIIDLYLPKINPTLRKQIRKFCKERGIAIYNDQLRKTLEGVELAIIRHRYTDYDSIVKVVGKKRARFYIGQGDIT